MLSHGGRIRSEFIQFGANQSRNASRRTKRVRASDFSEPPFHLSSQHNLRAQSPLSTPSWDDAEKRHLHKQQYFLIREHVSAKRYSAARDCWIESGFRPQTRIEYNMLLQALAKLGARDHCLALFDEMKQRARIVPDVVTFAIVMRVYVRAPSASPATGRDPLAGQDGVEWIDMDDLDTVDGHARMNTNEAAFCRLYAEMKSCGVAPDQVIYDILLAMYAKDTSNQIFQHSYLPKPWDIISQMRVEGIKPSVRSYNYLLMVYGGMARYRLRTEGVVGKQEAVDWDVPVESLTGGNQSFNTFGIDYEGEKLSREPEENGIEDVKFTPSKLDESVDILCREMRILGLQFNDVTYTVLIEYYATRNNVRMVAETFASMKRDGVTPGLVTYNTMLTFYRRTRRNNEVLALCREMMATGLMPDAYTFSTVCAMFSAAAETVQERKWRLRKKMKARKVDSNTPSSNDTELDTERNSNPSAPPLAANANATTSAAEAITESAMLFNATQELLTAKDLLLFYHQMKATGMRPNVVTYNTLLNAFCKLRDIPAMHLLLIDMSREKVLRDVRTYNMFLRMYMFSSAIRMRHRKLCVRGLLDEMSRAGIAPDSVTKALKKKFSRTCARREQIHLAVGNVKKAPKKKFSRTCVATRKRRLALRKLAARNRRLRKLATMFGAWTVPITNRE